MLCKSLLFSYSSSGFAEYTPDEIKATAYQSEAELENEFIRLLTTLGYEYLKINSEDELISNLRKQLEVKKNLLNPLLLR